MADIRIICQDRIIWGVRILLALAYPSLKDVLAGRDDEDGLTLTSNNARLHSQRNRGQSYVVDRGKF